MNLARQKPKKIAPAFKSKGEARKACQAIGLISFDERKFKQISQLGEHFEELGPIKIGHGLLAMGLDKAVRLEGECATVAEFYKDNAQLPEVGAVFITIQSLRKQINDQIIEIGKIFVKRSSDGDGGHGGVSRAQVISFAPQMVITPAAGGDGARNVTSSVSTEKVPKRGPENGATPP